MVCHFWIVRLWEVSLQGSVFISKMEVKLASIYSHEIIHVKHLTQCVQHTKCSYVSACHHPHHHQHHHHHSVTIKITTLLALTLVTNSKVFTAHSQVIWTFACYCDTTWRDQKAPSGKTLKGPKRQMSLHQLTNEWQLCAKQISFHIYCTLILSQWRVEEAIKQKALWSQQKNVSASKISSHCSSLTFDGALHFNLT